MTKSNPPNTELLALAEEADRVCRTAKRLRKSLVGVNFYADKLARLRTEAALVVQTITNTGQGDPAALRALAARCFDPATPPAERSTAIRELRHELMTTWNAAAPAALPGEDSAVIPMTLVEKTRRGYLVRVARQVNGCFVHGWYDACAVMMRRLIETAIIEAYEACGIADRAKKNGEFLPLTDLIDAVLAEKSWNLQRGTKTVLPKMKDLGHTSAHARHYTTQKAEIEKVQHGHRVAVEEFLSRAKLL